LRVAHELNDDEATGAFILRGEGPVPFGLSYRILKPATGGVVWALKLDRPFHLNVVDEIVDALAEHAAMAGVLVVALPGPFKRSLSTRHPSLLVPEPHPELDELLRAPEPRPPSRSVTTKLEVGPTLDIVRYARIFTRRQASFARVGRTRFRGAGDRVWVTWPTDRIQRLGFTPLEEVESTLDPTQLARIRRREALVFEVTQTETPCNSVTGIRLTRECLQGACAREDIVPAALDVTSWARAATEIVYPYLVRAAAHAVGSRERDLEIDAAVGLMSRMKKTERLDAGAVRVELARLIGG
jgi:hypothetical protein